MTPSNRCFGGNSINIYPTKRRRVSEHCVLQWHHSEDLKFHEFLQHNEKWEKDSCVNSNSSRPIKMMTAISQVCPSRDTNMKPVECVICYKSHLMCQWENLNPLELLNSGFLHSYEQTKETPSWCKCLIKCHGKCSLDRCTLKRLPRDRLE